LSPRRKAAIAFTTAIVLLTLGGAATGITMWNLLESLRWLAHSYQVEVALGDIDSTLTRAARSRAVYIQTADPDYYRQFAQSLNAIAPEMGNMEHLVSDNPLQKDLIKRLEDVTSHRADLLQKSVKIRHDGVDDPSAQADIGRETLSLGLDQSDLVHQMQGNESGLIGQRRRISDQQFEFVLALLGLTFITSALLFWWHFSLLRHELKNREEMEEATRRLSSHVLEMQDEERRRFSRELHDSLGQILTAAKLNMSALMKTYPKDMVLFETEQFLDQAVQETRTISYLLHPPLLDELGFVSAAEWYVDGFSKRSGIQVDLKIAAEVTRLPHSVELVLFRVLQESLSNVIRHAKANRAEVNVNVPRGGGVVLQVRDFGVGIPADMLEQFNRTGARVGVGLAGMRERVREQGGTFVVTSSTRGTSVTVTMPRISVAAGREIARLRDDSEYSARAVANAVPNVISAPPVTPSPDQARTPSPDAPFTHAAPDTPSPDASTQTPGANSPASQRPRP
jgi:signal transduction histidine kinase